RAAAQVLGFALSPDGGTVLLGYGDPRDGDLVIDQSVLGIYRSSTSDFAFTRLSSTSTTCLRWTSAGVYACTSPLETGYTVAFAPNGNIGPDGGNLQPLLVQGGVDGPLSCCGQNSVCAEAWSSACAIFASCDAGAPMCLPEAGMTSAGRSDASSDAAS